MSYRSRGTRTRALAGVVAALLALGLLPLFSGVANAQARNTAQACPANPPDPFTDDEGNIHEPNINCIAFWDITEGTTATTYSPNAGTRRDQMATFIAEFIRTSTGTDLPANAPDAFTDDETSVHEANINALAAANVVNGTTATTFSPSRLVTRAQMATFIAQAIDYINDGQIDGDQPPATTNDAFTDDENSVHEANINRLAAVNIVVGTGGGQFNPDASVTRAQMASFIAQAADYVAEVLGLWPPIPGATVTSRPELTSASIVSTVTSGILQGTTVAYAFDEAVTCQNAALFWAISASGVRTSGGSCSTGANSSTINVLYPTINTTAAAGNLTLATVDLGAVIDSAGEQNPIGDAGLGAQGGQALTAGITGAPDLTNVTNFRTATSTQTFVDFVFDEAATNLIPGGYHLVDLTGTVDIAGTLDSGNGTTTHTVVFTNTQLNAGGTQIQASQISRGYDVAGTVQDTAGVTNPKQAADVSNNGNTGAPDLVSASFNLSATSGGANVDQATLVFDEAVTAGPGGNAAFQAYLTNGTEVNPTSVAFSTTTPNQVLLTFADGALTNAVGVSIDDQAVLAATGANVGRDNEDDEVGAANQTSAQVAGRTTDPDLISVSRVNEVDIFGNPTGDVVFVYTFDEDVLDNSDVETLFFILLPDGTRMQAAAGTCTTVTGTTNATDAQVTCDEFVDPRTTANATVTVQQSAVLGTVDNGAVTAETGGGTNHEGAEVITNA